MDLFGGGWTRVTHLVTGNSGAGNCPGEWVYEPAANVCRRHDDAISTATFQPVVPYREVLGRAVGAQKGTPDAFTGDDLDAAYADGLSLTALVGGVREHVWTWAVGLTETPGIEPNNQCPCTGTDATPAVVGDAWACDTAGVDYPPQEWLTGALWDDESTFDAQCTQAPGPRWFVRELSTTVTAPLEARLMADQARTNEDVGVQRLELYVR